MEKIRIDLRYLSVEDKISWAKAIETSIAENHFISSSASLAGVLRDVTQEMQRVHSELLAQQERVANATLRLAEVEDQWNRIVAKLSQRIRRETQGKPGKMASFGFCISSDEQWSANQVRNLAVTAGDSDGTLDLMFDPVRGTEAYEFQTTAQPELEDWQFKAMSITSRITLSGLPSGKRVWVRVRAVSAHGVGPWSREVTKLVP